MVKSRLFGICIVINMIYGLYISNILGQDAVVTHWVCPINLKQLARYNEQTFNQSNINQLPSILHDAGYRTLQFVVPCDDEFKSQEDVTEKKVCDFFNLLVFQQSQHDKKIVCMYHADLVTFLAQSNKDNMPKDIENQKDTLKCPVMRFFYNPRNIFVMYCMATLLCYFSISSYKSPDKYNSIFKVLLLRAVV